MTLSLAALATLRRFLYGRMQFALTLTGVFVVSGLVLISVIKRTCRTTTW